MLYKIYADISTSDLKDISRCNSLEQAVPLELEEGWEESRLLGSASNDVNVHFLLSVVNASLKYPFISYRCIGQPDCTCPLR